MRHPHELNWSEDGGRAGAWDQMSAVKWTGHWHEKNKEKFKKRLRKHQNFFLLWVRMVKHLSWNKIRELGKVKTQPPPHSPEDCVLLHDKGGEWAAVAFSPPATAPCSLSCEPESVQLWAQWHMLVHPAAQNVEINTLAIAPLSDMLHLSATGRFTKAACRRS